MATNGLTAIHTINPVDVDIRGSKAFAVSVGSIRARFERSGCDYDLISQCRFLSRLQRLNGHSQRAWKLLSMEVIYLYDSILPTFPQGGHSPLVIENMPDTTRKSYKYLSWLLMEQGHEVDSRMPGVDDETSVRDVMDRNFSWLNS
jgi:hypothetical protein